MLKSSHSQSNHKSTLPVSGNEVAPYRLMAVLLSLYFAQGLPSGFITQALPAILRQYDVSLRMIGWSGLLLAPWALKFLWAPVVDRYYSARLGRGRSWILPLQLLSALIVFAVGFIDPNTLAQPAHLWALFGLLFVLSMVGATHDVATDSLATRSLTHHRATTGLDDDITEVVQSVKDKDKVNAKQNPYQGLGNAVQVVGYRLGLILGGGVFLMVLGRWSWQLSFAIMAALIMINLIPIWCYPETDEEAKRHGIDSSTTIKTIINPETADNQGAQIDVDKSVLSLSSIKQYLQEQYGYFWHNRQMRAWLGVLLTYKIVDGISSGMVKPMMVDMGITTASIGLWISVIGSVASLIGAGIAAWVLKRVAHYQALLWFNVFQLLATGLYVLVAMAYEYQLIPAHNQTGLYFSAYVANAIEHMAAAMALVAMLTMVMHYARHQQAGSDFTTQICLLTVFSGSAHLLSGYLAEWLGYTGHFLLSVMIGVVCLLPILYWQRLYKSQLNTQAN